MMKIPLLVEVEVPDDTMPLDVSYWVHSCLVENLDWPKIWRVTDVMVDESRM